MLSDIKRELVSELGITNKIERVTQHAIYIVDLCNIRFMMVTDGNVGRNPNEVLRVLDALQTDERCPSNCREVTQPSMLRKFCGMLYRINCSGSDDSRFVFYFTLQSCYNVR